MSDDDDLSRSSGPHVAARCHDRAAARRPAAARRGQRLLRRRRVRARARAALAHRGGGRAGRGRRAQSRSPSCDEITEYLSACQLGITLASIGIGFLGEPAIAKLIEPAFGGLSHGAAAAISIAIAYLIVTVVHITVGEQVPKVWAIQRADRTVRRISRPLHLFARVFHPFVVLLNRASNGILRLLRVDPDFGEEAAGRRRSSSC